VIKSVKDVRGGTGYSRIGERSSRVWGGIKNQGQPRISNTVRREGNIDEGVEWNRGQKKRKE